MVWVGSIILGIRSLPRVWVGRRCRRRRRSFMVDRQWCVLIWRSYFQTKIFKEVINSFLRKLRTEIKAPKFLWEKIPVLQVLSVGNAYLASSHSLVTLGSWHSRTKVNALNCQILPNFAQGNQIIGYFYVDLLEIYNILCKYLPTFIDWHISLGLPKKVSKTVKYSRCCWSSMFWHD